MNLVHKLNKTLNSINSHWDRGSRYDARSQALLVRYTDLKYEAQKTSEWSQYCKENNLVESHTASDFNA